MAQKSTYPPVYFNKNHFPPLEDPLKKRGYDPTAHLKWVLDQMAKDIHQDPFPLLFPTSASP